MKASKSVKTKILVIPCIAIVFYLVMFGLFYGYYLVRDEKAFSSIREDTKKSLLLKEKFGDIKDVKYDNFMSGITTKDDYKCIKFKVYTEDNSYKVCTIFKDLDYGGYAIGYVINNKVYMEGN